MGSVKIMNYYSLLIMTHVLEPLKLYNSYDFFYCFYTIFVLYLKSAYNLLQNRIFNLIYSIYFFN